MAPITVETGPMFSDKTKDMITQIERRIRSGQEVGKDFLVFTHILDTRYGNGVLASHDSRLDQFKAITIFSSNELLAHLFDADPDGNITGIKSEFQGLKAIFIDEGQFFDEGFLRAVDFIDRSFIPLQEREEDFQLWVAGLDLNAFGEPFGPMPELMALAAKVIKTHAICAVSGFDAATKSQRVDKKGNPIQYGSDEIVVGKGDKYYPVTTKNHVVPGRPPPKIIFERKSSG